MENLMRLVVGLLSAVVLASSGLVRADELILQDGSRLIGKVVRVKDGAIVFETGYAGTLQVQWDALQDMQVDEPVEVYLENREIVQATGIRKSGDSLTLEQAAAGSREISVQQFVSVNPEDWEQGIGYHLSGHANAGLELQDGNTEQQKLALDGDMKMRRLNDRTTFVARYQKDKSDSVTTAENWLFHSKYDYFVTAKRYFGAALNFENDRFADLRLRTSLGPHAGYQFFESKEMNLSADISLLYVMDDYYEAEDEEYPALGWNIDFDRMLLAERMQFYHRQNGLVEAGEWGDVVVNSWTGLRIPIYAGLVASTELQVDYDGGAPDDVDEVDTIWRVKLGYQW